MYRKPIHNAHLNTWRITAIRLGIRFQIEREPICLNQLLPVINAGTTDRMPAATTPVTETTEDVAYTTSTEFVALNLK